MTEGHGTFAAYNRGCRCEACAGHRRDYDRRRYDRLATSRFRPEGPEGYRARQGGPLRATREEAEADACRGRGGRPRLLDLFCGAGGAAMGYHRAGFEVVGVDIKPQPHYPFEFHQADALTFPLDGFDAIHASPPCQAYSSATPREHDHPDLYAPTRTRLVASGLPYVIENVIGAPYSHGVVLCGSMFGLREGDEWIQRHRNFEPSWFMFQPECAHPKGHRPINVTGNSFTTVVREYEHSRQGPFELAQRLMGIDWTTRDELAQAIPPAYTEWIGRQLLAVLEVAA